MPASYRRHGAGFLEGRVPSPMRERDRVRGATSLDGPDPSPQPSPARERGDCRASQGPKRDLRRLSTAGATGRRQNIGGPKGE
ncbi:MAG: hypothetical protein CMH16_27095 [Methylobacterium sp.]|nr:hypothetical protein [Methylobacterium sp.]